MLGLNKVNLLALSSLLVPALAASIGAGNRGIEISDKRVTRTEGVFAAGEIVTGRDIGFGGLIIGDPDNSFVSEIREQWKVAQGSSSGIYQELQQVAFVLYPDQSKPWPEEVKFAIYLAPLNMP
ncbi:hypothetical protein ACLX1H_011264 [Fusarium chlamydosporum]